MNDIRKYERDERKGMQRIVAQMNEFHATMGGRDKRPERVALLRAMQILQRDVERSDRETVGQMKPLVTVGA